MPRHTNPRPTPPAARASAHSPQAPHTFELVELRWVLKALAAVFALALVCGYITVCVVYSRTQWQLVLHPSREIQKTPAAVDLAFEEVHFGADSSGQPQLDGWWLPSDLPTDPTVLLLHSGDGSIADALAQAHILHDARLNVLLFDYRGFGHSGGQHPTQATMEADADSALTYLTTIRNLAPRSVVVFGTGVGGSLAVRLCGEHPQLPALILQFPRGDLKTQAVRDGSPFFPARLLFTQDFPLADPLHTLATPKLLITSDETKAPIDLHEAADPKMILTLTGAENEDAILQSSIRRFLDSYVASPPATLAPNP